MPRTIDEGFNDFLRKLTPRSTESVAAQRHRASILDCLTTNFGLKRFVRIGSFGNGTSISGYSDVDYLACLPTDQLTQSSTYSLIKVRKALAIRFPNTGVRISCPAVVCPFGISAANRTEIVTADEVGEENGFKIYDIADGAGGWMHASPDAHNTYVRSIDERLGGKVKPLIRFVKAWKYYHGLPISSFYLELRVAKYASGESTIVYDVDVKQVLQNLWDCQLAAMQDPMHVSGYIPACKSDVLRKTALSKLSTAVTRAEKALAVSYKGNIRAAFYWWRLLYNGRFPTHYYT
jgi:hypothetical protein